MIKEGRIRIHWNDGTSHDMSVDPMRPIQITNPNGDVWSLGSCDRWTRIEQLPPVEMTADEVKAYGDAMRSGITP